MLVTQHANGNLFSSGAPHIHISPQFHNDSSWSDGDGSVLLHTSKASFKVNLLNDDTY